MDALGPHGAWEPARLGLPPGAGEGLGRAWPQAETGSCPGTPPNRVSWRHAWEQGLAKYNNSVFVTLISFIIDLAKAKRSVYHVWQSNPNSEVAMRGWLTLGQSRGGSRWKR